MSQRVTTPPHQPDNAAMTTPNAPLPVLDAPRPIEADLEPLLGEPFASALSSALTPSQSANVDMVRGKLLQRLSASHVAALGKITARHARLPKQTLAPGVQQTLLYTAPAGRTTRPGEPLRASLLAFDAGSTWTAPPPGPHREWLVLRGALDLGSEQLTQRDYHVDPAGSTSPRLASSAGALVFLRESDQDAAASDAPFTVRDADAGWPDYAPGIQRRVLWQRQGQAALLYYTQPGADVPHHTHGHDEECLMVQGELFLDDILLQEGDYQLAPAGTGHRITATDTGVVLYAHGDLDLQFVG